MLGTDLGFDATINYKTDDIDQALDRLCPNGINIYFDNVGGTILDACLDRLVLHARIGLWGDLALQSRHQTIWSKQPFWPRF
jgi:NADPH-dependent curcumin reductase CurA